MKIRDLDVLVQQEQSGLDLGKSAEQAFGKASLPKLSGGFYEPMCCLQRFLVWLWLIQFAQRFQRIDAVSNEVLRRSMQLYSMQVYPKYRGEFEFLLLCSSIAGGTYKIAKELADHVEPGVPNSSVYSICAGIMKFRLLGDADRESEQFLLFRNLKGKAPAIRVGDWTLWKAFSEGKNEQVRKIAAKSCKTYSEKLVGSLDLDERQSETVSFAHWPLNSYWPWTELVLLKLGFGTDNVPTMDGFWLPDTLLQRADTDHL